MSDLPLHVEAPAPVPEKTREIDRSGTLSPTAFWAIVSITAYSSPARRK